MRRILANTVVLEFTMGYSTTRTDLVPKVEILIMM